MRPPTFTYIYTGSVLTHPLARLMHAPEVHSPHANRWVSSPHLKDHANSLGKDHATDGYPTCTYMYLPERLDAQ